MYMYMYLYSDERENLQLVRVSDSVNRVTRFIKVFGKERIFIFALLASARKNDL